MSQEPNNKDNIIKEKDLNQGMKEVLDQNKEIENITIHLDQFENKLQDFWNWSFSLGSMSAVRSFDEAHEILMSDFKKLREELGK